MKNRLRFNPLPIPAAAFFLLLLAALGLLYWPLLFQDKTIYWRDVLVTYFPLQEFITQSLKAGDFPLWNPYLFAGTPQVAGAEPPVFYPGTWIFLGLDFAHAVTFNLILHQGLAAAGVLALGRAYAWQWWSCILAALAFTFSGVVVSMNNVYPLLWTSAWIPWLVWACHQVMAKGKWSQSVWLALFYGLQILSGHLEIVYFTTLLLLIYTAVVLPRAPAGSKWKSSLAGWPFY